jgi:hypothetical protein
MLRKDHPEKQRHLSHGRREDFAPRRIELALSKEIIEDRSVFRSEELLEPVHHSDFLFDDDAPRRYGPSHQSFLGYERKSGGQNRDEVRSDTTETQTKLPPRDQQE